MRSLSHSAKRPRFAVLLVLLLIQAGVAGEMLYSAAHEDCRRMLERAYAALDSTALQKGIYLRYIVGIKGRAKYNVRSQNLDLELTASAGRAALTGSDIAVYYDEKHSATLLKGEGRLVLADAARHNAGQMMFFNALRDSLLSHAQFLACESFTGPDGKPCKRISFKPVSGARQPINKCVVEVQADTYRILASTLYFGAFYPLESVRYRILELRENYAPALRQPGVYERFFTGRGSLRPEYSEFTVNDVRNTKR